MKIAVIGVLIGLAIAVAFFLLDSKPPPPSDIDDKHRAAAILVARCDTAMSSLELELGSSPSPGAAIASRIDACTRAKAAVERAREDKTSHQLDVALERVTQHLDKLATMGGSAAIVVSGSATGSADPAGSKTGSTAGSNGGSSAGSTAAETGGRRAGLSRGGSN